jgi:hypothetical protein
MNTTDKGYPADLKSDPLGPDHGQAGHLTPPVATDEHFDREINLKAISWTVVSLVAVTVTSLAVVWFLLKGFDRFDDDRDPALTPIRAASPQQPPPEPRLQVSPGFQVTNPGETQARSEDDDMHALRAEEDELLGRAGWVQQDQGILRVPIDLAIEAIAARGIAPLSGGTDSSAQVPPASTVPPVSTVPDTAPAMPSGTEGLGQ